MKLLFTLLIVAILLFIYIRALERRTLFFPSKEIEMTPDIIGLAYEDVMFENEDGVALNGWFVPAKKAGAKTLVFAHGNAGNISGRISKISMFHDLGLNVFIFDYQGYGNSDGRPSEAGLYKDAQAAYDYLVHTRKFSKENIIIFGASLGGAVAIDLAAHRPAKALIVEATFSSGADMAKSIYPFLPACIIQTKLDSESKIKNITVPKLFLHPMMDEVVPYDLGQKLFSAAPEPKSFVRLLGGHNDACEVDRERYVKSVKQFLEGL